MANIKFNKNVEASGVYDSTQAKTQAYINENELRGLTVLGTSSTLEGSIPIAYDTMMQYKFLHIEVKCKTADKAFYTANEYLIPTSIIKLIHDGDGGRAYTSSNSITNNYIDSFVLVNDTGIGYWYAYSQNADITTPFSCTVYGIK